VHACSRAFALIKAARKNVDEIDPRWRGLGALEALSPRSVWKPLHGTDMKAALMTSRYDF